MPTTGSEVVRAGASLFVFSAIGLAHVHYVLPRLSRLLRFPPWHERPSFKRWNYGVGLVLAAIGGVTMAVGAIAWATGMTFG